MHLIPYNTLLSAKVEAEYPPGPSLARPCKQCDNSSMMECASFSARVVADPYFEILLELLSFSEQPRTR